MGNSIFTIDDLIKFCNNKLSLSSLIFSRRVKILVFFLLGLTIIFLLKALEIMFYYPNLYGHYFGFIGFSIITFLSILFIRRRMMSKLPEGISLSQLKIAGLETYLISHHITRDDLEHIQKILLREESNSKTTISLALPGAALILLPLWNAFLVKEFSFIVTSKDTTKYFSNFFPPLFLICIILWLGSVALTSFKNEKYFSLKAINRLIEELLINGYELKQ